MRKVKLVLRVAKKGAKKILREGVAATYKGRPIYVLPAVAAKQFMRLGPKGFVLRLKKEIVGIDRRLGTNLAFPNGLTTGVDRQVIDDWYKHKSKKVSIVIPSYNDEAILRPLVESLEATVDPAKAEVVIVDDYAQPTSRAFLKTLESDLVRVIYRDKNGGFAKAVSTGIEAAHPKNDIILLNNDMIAHEGWLEALQYGAYEFGTDTGIVGGKLLYPDGRIQSAGSYRNTEATEYFDHYYRFQDANYGPANIPHYCLAVTGACMYIKREVLENVGSIDTNYQFAFEDVDLCLRAWEQGYRTLYFPAAVLTHMESVSRPKNTTISTKEQQSISYFWSKWGDWFDKRNVKDADGRPRIIFVLQTLGYSGGIRIVFEQANRLSRRGFAVEVWGLDTHQSPWEAEPGVKIRTFKNYDRLIAALAPLEAIKVATWWETAFPVWMSSVIKGIPVYFIQEMETWFYPNDVVAQASVVSCYRKEFRNMTTSQYNLEEIRALGLKAVAVPCGYDDKIYRPLPNMRRDEHTILALGRTFFQKNFMMTFKAWKLLGPDRPTLKLFGQEEEMAKLDKKIDYVKRPSNEAVNKLYNEATIFVQTSRHEGFCLPLLEAMATGVPAICTDAHGNRDFCQDGKNCLMVAQDDVDGLAAAMKRLLANKALRARLSKAAAQTAKKYRWDTVMDKVEAFYRELVV